MVIMGSESVCVLDMNALFAEQQGYMIRAPDFTELFLTCLCF